MDLVVNEELKATIDPLTAEEYEALERSLLAEGCRDALVLWGQVLVDGHNRYEICRKHGLPFTTVQNPRFQSIEDVHLWMIDQHLGRRSVSDFQRGVLALRKREIVGERRAREARRPSSASGEVPAPSSPDAGEGPHVMQAAPSVDAGTNAPAPKAVAASLEAADALETREALARAARLSSNQVVLIEKIRKQAAPEVVAAVKAGVLSINAAAAVAMLPAAEQAAAAAGGADELRLAARRVRESRRKPAAATAAEQAARDATAAVAVPAPEAAMPIEAPTVASLLQRVADLEAENAALRAEVSRLRHETPPAPAGTASDA